MDKTSNDKSGAPFSNGAKGSPTERCLQHALEAWRAGDIPAMQIDIDVMSKAARIAALVNKG